MKLKNKIALITGGGTGIGKATAFLFAKEGARVVITGRREQILQGAVIEAKTENLEIEYLVSDVSEEKDCKAAVDYTVSKFGRIDILFNNAGVSYMGITHETSTELWDKTFDINVKGIYLMSKYAIPYMIEEKSGCIVNNSSILGLKASPAGFAAYSSSKGAVNQLTRSMALEYADKGIRVNGICPGTIYTPMMDDLFDKWSDREVGEKRYISVHPIGRLAQPEEIAHAVLFLCDDNIKFMTGTMLSVDGGMSAK
ncbi:MAG: SDR family oxidoreductase [Thermodesulfobacteriales bacterium]|jgi:NAD(P)-dependent dehydrogenase (short-subunit alcohol dehydrogenase family)|nr:MAG: SDR family oxidoreductase [Thermodesulfobacteriales bacterium]